MYYEKECCQMTERRADHVIYLKQSNLYLLISKNVQHITFGYSQVSHIFTVATMRT